MESPNSLCIVWTSGDPAAGLNMALMYAKNSKKKAWWDTVRIIVWGPSQETLLDDGDLQEALGECAEAGVELWACKACADNCDAAEDLEDLGIDVLYVGEDLTRMLKDGDWTVLTV